MVICTKNSGKEMFANPESPFPNIQTLLLDVLNSSNERHTTVVARTM